MTMNPPRTIDLFCGAGGLSEGFRQAGFNVGLGLDWDAVSAGPSQRTTREWPSLAATFATCLERIS